MTNKEKVENLQKILTPYSGFIMQLKTLENHPVFNTVFQQVIDAELQGYENKIKELEEKIIFLKKLKKA